MQVLLFACLSLIHFSFATQPQTIRVAPDRAIIQRRQLRLVRSASLAKQFPDRKTALVSYPVISGLTPTALRRVRSLLSFKSIFDYSLAEYQNDAWLSEFDYVVNHNGDHLLDLTFTQSGMAAYPDEQSKHFLIDLRTGGIITAGDAFQAGQLAELAALVDSRLQADIEQLKKDNATSKEIDPSQRASIDDAYAVLKFGTKELNDFSVSQKGITFLYDAGFPHVIKALEPNGRYFFTYADLKQYIREDGPLAQFIHQGLK